MKKTRVLVDARFVGSEGQGAITYIAGLYNAMFDHFGETYEFFFTGKDFRALKAIFPFMEKSHFIPVVAGSYLKWFFVELPRVLRKLKTDFAHFKYMTPFVKPCKFIVTTHDVLFMDFPKDFGFFYTLQRSILFKKALMSSDIRLTVSNYSKERIQKHFGVDPKTVFGTPNAVRAEFFEPYDKQVSIEYIRQTFGIENYILYVSRIEDRKNHQLLLRAYDELRLAEKEVQLVFIGNDTLGSTTVVREIEKRKAAYPGKVHWISGFVTDEDLLAFYRGAKQFVFPSKAEGFGIPPIEAAAARINTLCANATAMSDFTFFGDNLFSPDNLGELKSKICKNLENPPDENRLSEISKAIWKTYSWKQSAEVLHELIQNETVKEKLLIPQLLPTQ